MAIGNTWQQLEDWNANELKTRMDKIKQHKIKPGKVVTCRMTRVISGCTRSLSKDMLSSIGWKTVLPGTDSNVERKNML